LSEAVTVPILAGWALIGPETLVRRAALGLDGAGRLADNDVGGFFAGLGDLVVTGPTPLTNVNDFRAILIDQGEGP
jgi:hydroxypyruvate reductase